MIEQVEAARCWAKVLAYKRCGQEAKAREWWLKLAEMLGYGPQPVRGAWDIGSRDDDDGGAEDADQ